jgi:hypothetical protein
VCARWVPLVDASAALTHLSLSLSLSCPSNSAGSLSCPSNSAGLAPSSQRFSGLFTGHGDPRPHAPGSKLPCHAIDDNRRPREVTRDRSLAYTHANVRQAHREWTCRAPGGAAASPGAGRISLVQRACSSVVATTLIVASGFEEAPVRAPKRTGSDVERRGLNPRPRRSQRLLSLPYGRGGVCHVR